MQLEVVCCGAISLVGVNVSEVLAASFIKVINQCSFYTYTVIFYFKNQSVILHLFFAMGYCKTNDKFQAELEPNLFLRLHIIQISCC